jgi:hypothetical protein
VSASPASSFPTVSFRLHHQSASPSIARAFEIVGKTAEFHPLLGRTEKHNRSLAAFCWLPPIVERKGIIVTQTMTSMLKYVNIYSTEKDFDQNFYYNCAINVVPNLSGLCASTAPTFSPAARMLCGSTSGRGQSCGGTPRISRMCSSRSNSSVDRCGRRPNHLRPRFSRLSYQSQGRWQVATKKPRPFAACPR